jgi:aryl-alcohol dehydrogenase-like predicted oxidoreductase
MNYRPFGGESEVRVSEVGLGAWQIGGSWGTVSEQDALDILRAATDAGVNFFDTADVYGNGRSERLIGRFLKETGKEIFVASKLGRAGTPGWPANFTLPVMRTHTESSLRRLGIETLDLTQLHCVPLDTLKEGEVFESLRTLRQEGKIRRFGVSVESMEEAHLCLEQEGLSSLQIIFNIFRQKPATDLFDAAKAKGVALIIRLPLASGLLSGKFNAQSQFPKEDHRNFNRDGQAFNVGETFAGLPFEKGVELADGLKPLVPNGLTMAQMALRWILDFDAVTAVIPGAKNVAQAAANAVPSGAQPLSEDLHARLRDFYEQEVRSHIRGPY